MGEPYEIWRNDWRSLLGLLFVGTPLRPTVLYAQSNYTIQATRIEVPASATGLTNGDTTAEFASNNIALDRWPTFAHLPNTVASPAPVILVLHGFGDTKNYSETVLLAQDFANAGYVVVAPTLRGFGNSGGLVTLAGSG